MIKPIQQAESLYDQKKYTESIEIALYSIKEGEEILRSYKIIAKANKEMKRNEEAIDYMLKVVSITPDDYECYKDLGNMYLILNQNDLAKEAYQTSLDKKSNYYPSLGNLGIMYFIDGNYERSIYYLLKAIKSNPQFAEAWVNLSNCYLKQGKLIEAKESALISVKLRYDWDKVHQILAIVYCELREFKLAQSSISKSLELSSDNTQSSIILIEILIHLGKINEAKDVLLRRIEKSPLNIHLYYLLSTIKDDSWAKGWKAKLLEIEVDNINDKSKKILAWFAKSNIYHQSGRYTESAKCLVQGNDLKLILQPSNLDEVIIKSQKLLQSQKRTGVIKLGKSKKIDYIFIIGLPRSGSTLLESILSMNTKTFPLGETNLLEESYKEWKNSSNVKQLNHYYDLGKAKFRKGKYISIDKNLFNFRYLDLIATKFPNAFVIHTYRHPLDNLLSIYRAKFKSAHINYSSSLVDTTKMIMDTEKVIAEYDNIIGNKIYHLNYDLLVNSPEIIIRDLIKSLNLEWKNNYLSPHSNTRPVSTASKISVRSPINNKSVGIWKEYEKMLRPAIKIFESDKVFSRIIKSSLK